MPTYLSRSTLSRRLSLVRLGLVAALLCFAFSHAHATKPGSTERGVYPEKEGIVQPIHFDQLPPWLSFDMELRGRTEEQTSLNYVYDKDRLYELTRVYGGIRLTPTNWLTGYAQFHDDHALGLPLRDVASNMRDVFDLFQGYLNFHYREAQFVAGRQLLIFGDQRVIGISDWTNNSRSWDGFDLRLGQKNTLDLFSTSVVTIHPESLDNHGAGLTFHGGEASINTLLPNTSLQPFVLVRALPSVTSQQGIKGTETEVTPGIYFDTALPNGLSASGTGDLQRGSYSNDSIHAGAGIIRGGYQFKRVPWVPQLQAEYDYATGNPHTDPERIGTYDQQYPSNHNAFGLVDLFGFQNIKQRRLNLYISPRPNLFVLFQTGSLPVATPRDGIYGGAGPATFHAPAAGFPSDDMGTEFDASAKYVFRKAFVTNIGVGHFFPGEVMTSANHGAPLTLAYLQFTYRFSLSKTGNENAK